MASNLLLYSFNLSSSSRIFDPSPMRRRASKYPKARAYGELVATGTREDLATISKAYLSSRSCRHPGECGNGNILKEVPSHYCDQ